MNEFITNLNLPISSFELYLILAVVIIGIMVLIKGLFKANKLKKYEKKLNQYIIEQNGIKSVPLTFKMNKAIAISKVSVETQAILENSQKEYEEIQKNNETLSLIISECHEMIKSKKIKYVKGNLDEINEYINGSKKIIVSLESKLDTILEQEALQRTKITGLKEKFRNIKEKIISNESSYSTAVRSIEMKIVELENSFSMFEEWMFASEYGKTSQMLEVITKNLNDLINIENEIPKLIKLVKVNVTVNLNEVKSNYEIHQQRKVYLEHLNFPKVYEDINGRVKDIVKNINEAKYEGIENQIYDILKQIKDLNTQFAIEEDAFKKIKRFLINKKEIEKISELNEYIQNVYDKVETHYGLSVLKEDIEKNIKRFEELKIESEKVAKSIEELQGPCSKLLVGVEALTSDFNALGSFSQDIKRKLEQADSDEKRAFSQLEIFHVNINHLDAILREYKLNSISKSFFDNLDEARARVNEIQKLLDTEPVNIPLLNYKVKETLDYTYELCRQFLCLINIASLCESTIVFLNRYRSSIEECDIELTRAEIFYGEGDYATALDTLVTATERMFGVGYDKLLKEKRF